MFFKILSENEVERFQSFLSIINFTQGLLENMNIDKSEEINRAFEMMIQNEVETQNICKVIQNIGEIFKESKSIKNG